MQKYKCLIVDDEPLAREAIEIQLENYSNFIVAGKCSNAIEAFAAIKNDKIDLIFLDIQMPGITGIDFLNTIKNPPEVIFTTAYSEYALDGFELDVVDYLLKPISDDRFMKAIDKFYRKFNNEIHPAETGTSVTVQEHILIRAERKTFRIALSEILYVESLKDYVKVYTKTENYITKMNIGKMCGELPSAKFVRVHKSYIINIDNLSSYDSAAVWIEKKIIPIGNTYREKFLSSMSG